MKCPKCGSEDLFDLGVPKLLGDLPGTMKQTMTCCHCREQFDAFYKFSHTAY